MPTPFADIPKDQQRAVNASFPNGSQNAGRMSLVFRVRRPGSPTPLKEHRLICMPTSFSREQEGRTQLYYTKGGVFVDTPETSGLGITIFTIAGHTLYKGLTQTSSPAAPGVPTFSVFGLDIPNPLAVLGRVKSLVGGQLQTGDVIDGAAAIKDLDDTIRAYFAPQKSPWTAAATRMSDLTLEFLHLNAPTSKEDPTGIIGYTVHPHHNLVTLRQDASKPFLWFYQLQFAAVPLDEAGPSVQADAFLKTFTSKKGLIGTVLDKLNGLVEGVNTFTAAFEMVTQEVTGPISSFVNGVGQLTDGVKRFVSGVEAKIRFPLYVAQSLRANVLDVLNLPSHSVQTLRLTAAALADVLNPVTFGRSISIPFAGTSLTAGVNDHLALAINREPPRTLHLGTQTSGSAIAAVIQDQVRALAPTYPANVSAYRDFMATYTPGDGRYVLQSGTMGQHTASVVALASEDLHLQPNDAASVLGLGPLYGGTEHAGSSLPLPALALLRDVIVACERLEAFPEYFAEALPEQTALLQRVQTAMVPQQLVQGDQFMTTTVLTPGDTLQAVAGREGIAWETLALANHLQYPYVLTTPTTLSGGQAAAGGSATTLLDLHQTWTPQRYQGQRVDLIAGPGAGQSRSILANTGDTLLIDHPWLLPPTATTQYAIRVASNPLIQTGQVTVASAQTLTDATLTLVPESQRGYTLRIITGAAAGSERRIVLHTANTYRLDRPWDAIPAPGSLYVIALPQAPVRRTVLYVGEPIAIPRPSRQQLPRSVRAPLQSIATLTGRTSDLPAKLFGTDLRLHNKTLTLVPLHQDLATLTGLTNLRQAVLHLLNLSMGELEYAPGLGSYVQESLGMTATLPHQTELLHSVQRTVKQDPRILSVGQTVLATYGGLVEISVQALAITGDTLDRITIR